jgi:signal transduction histidine kinase
VTVALNPGTDVLEIRVTDAGHRADPGDDPARPRSSARHPVGSQAGGPAEHGRGILGMRERCELLGGEFNAKPTLDGGFEVTARLPLAPAGSSL